MKMRTLFCAAAVMLSLFGSSAVVAASIVLISIDGLRPGDVADADKRGLSVPNLRRFLTEGSYATDVHGVLPTVTYPSHTTLLTGTSPARHGIVSNLTFDPLLKNQQGWYWYAEDIRVSTLWDAARAARLTTANVHWPVSVGARVDYNLPQIWRTGTPDDRKLLRALATPGLLDALEHDLGAYADGIDESIEGDETRGRFTVRIIENYHPEFMTTYFTALDHTQHSFGPDTPEAHAVLERIDTIVGKIVAAAHKSDSNCVVAVVSDHGFAPLAHDVNLMAAFTEAGLIKFDDKGKVSGWDAEPWYSGGSAAVVLHNPSDKGVHNRVRDVLQTISKNDMNGISKILDREQIGRLRGNPEADFYIIFKPGYQMAPELKEPMVSASTMKGMHGYDADLPEMRSTFLLMGHDIPTGKSLGSVDMRDIAPTLARILRVSLPEAEGKPVL